MEWLGIIVLGEGNDLFLSYSCVSKVKRVSYSEIFEIIHGCVLLLRSSAFFGAPNPPILKLLYFPLLRSVVTRRYPAKTCGTPTNNDARTLCLFAQVVVELMRVGCVRPLWLSLCERATSGTLTTSTIAISERIDDQPSCATAKQLLAELFNTSVRKTRANRYLSRYAPGARYSHHFPSLRQRWATLEAFEESAVVGFDGDSQPGLWFLHH